MNKVKIVLGKVWKVLRWVLLAAVILFILSIFIGLYGLHQQHQYALQLAEKLDTDRVTMVDVMGGRLPPPPDQAENDKTLMGIDSNHNGVRDDVELAIFKLHPDSARIRAAELQYAKYLQYTLDDMIFSGEVASTVDGRFMDSAIECLIETSDSFSGVTRDQIALENSMEKEVDNLVLDTESRTSMNARFNEFSRTSGVSVPNGHGCDLDIKELQN